MGKGGFSVDSIDCEGRVVCCMFYMKFTTHFSAATSLKSSKINIQKILIQFDYQKFVSHSQFYVSCNFLCIFLPFIQYQTTKSF